MKILVETSARHIHVSKEHLKVLFGENAELTIRRELSQPGQYVSDQRVDIVGPKRTISGVSILGPERNETQVEISGTDARSIGVPIVIRESGDLQGTPGCKIVGPCGELELDHGVIVAKRHIHMTPEDAKEAGLEDKQIVCFKVETNERKLVFGDVVVRVSPKFKLVCHIDTDESNAANCSGEVFGEIINCCK